MFLTVTRKNGKNSFLVKLNCTKYRLFLVVSTIKAGNACNNGGYQYLHIFIIHGLYQNRERVLVLYVNIILINQKILISKLLYFLDRQREYQCDAETTDFHKIALSVRQDPYFYEKGVRYYQIFNFDQS